MNAYDRLDHGLPRPSRRELLRQAGTGFGLLGLAALLADDTAVAAPPARDDRAADPLAVRIPHHAPRARSCIFLYMPGGPSQIDTFDPKPRVDRENGQP